MGRLDTGRRAAPGSTTAAHVPHAFPDAKQDSEAWNSSVATLRCFSRWIFLAASTDEQHTKLKSHAVVSGMSSKQVTELDKRCANQPAASLDSRTPSPNEGKKHGDARRLPQLGKPGLATHTGECANNAIDRGDSAVRVCVGLVLEAVCESLSTCTRGQSKLVGAGGFINVLCKTRRRRKSPTKHAPAACFVSWADSLGALLFHEPDSWMAHDDAASPSSLLCLSTASNPSRSTLLCDLQMLPASAAALASSVPSTAVACNVRFLNIHPEQIDDPHIDVIACLPRWGVAELAVDTSPVDASGAARKHKWQCRGASVAGRRKAAILRRCVRKSAGLLPSHLR